MKLRSGYNPLLKSYPDSEKVNRLSIGAEAFYVRLIAQSDDAGRYWGEPAMILARLFTHRMIAGEVDAAAVGGWLDELRRENLIELYTAGGRVFLVMVDVFKRLRQDVKPSITFPGPDASETTSESTRPASGPDTLRTRPESVTLEPATEPTQNQPRTTHTPASREGETLLGEASAPKPNGKSKPAITDAEAAAIYKAYPRKEDPEAAKKAIRAAVKRLTSEGNPDPVAYLLERTRAYAASPAGQRPPRGEKDFRKYPATWFSKGSYANEIDAAADSFEAIAPHTEPSDDDMLAVAQEQARMNGGGRE